MHNILMWAYKDLLIGNCHLAIINGNKGLARNGEIVWLLGKGHLNKGLIDSDNFYLTYGIFNHEEQNV